jgi:hypothetical protein
MMGALSAVIGAVSSFMGLAGGIHPFRFQQRPLEATPQPFVAAVLLESLCAGFSQPAHPVSHVVGAGVSAGAATALSILAYNHADRLRRTPFRDSDIAGVSVAIVLGGLLGYLNPIEMMARFVG